MRRSARRSSSIVRTPTRQAALSSSTTDASTRPARAIISISWSVLRLIMSFPSPATRDGPQDPLPDLVDAARAVHVGDHVLLAIVREHRERLLQVHADAPARGLRPVVLAHDQLGAVDVAQRVAVRRSELGMVRSPAVRTGQTAGHPAHQHLGRDLDEDHAVHAPAHRRQHVVQLRRLRHGAREAVEQHAAPRVRLLQAAPHQLQRDVVRHKVAVVQEALRLPSQRGVRLDLGPKEVAGRDLRDAEVLRQEARLGALAAPRGTEQGQVQWVRACDSRPPYLMNPRYWRMISCVSSCFMVSSATPTTMSSAVPPRYIWFCGMLVTRAAPSGSTTVMRPRKIAPANVTRFMTAARYSAVGLPGLMPGMKLE